MSKLSPPTRDKLKKISTATLTSILFKRGLRNQMIQDVHPLARSPDGNMVGEAFTLRYIPALDINVPIGCGDAPVFPGDVMVGDGDGVVVIPAHLADEVATEGMEMTAFEDFVTEEVMKGRSIIGLYPATHDKSLADFAAWRKARGR